jgi:hypothetical protein
MSFIRSKKIGNHKYAVEVTAYWDPVQKRSRQKTKYLGSIDEKGNIKKRIYNLLKS